MDDSKIFSGLEKLNSDIKNVLAVVIMIENDAYSQQSDNVIYGASCMVHEKLVEITKNIADLLERV